MSRTPTARLHSGLSLAPAPVMYSKQEGHSPRPLEEHCSDRSIKDMDNCDNGSTPINPGGNGVSVPAITSAASTLVHPTADIVINPDDEKKEQGKDKRRDVGSQSPQCGSGPFSSQISLGFNQSDFTLSQGIHSVPLHGLVREESVHEKAGIYSSGSIDSQYQDEDSRKEETHTAPNPSSHWDSRERSDIRLPTVQSILNAPWDPSLPQTTSAPSIPAIARDAIVHPTPQRLFTAVQLQSDIKHSPPSPPPGITPLLDTEHSPSPLILNESPRYDQQACRPQGSVGLAFSEFVNDSGTVDNNGNGGISVSASTQAQWDHYSHAAFPVYQQSGYDQFYVSQGLVPEHADIIQMSTRSQSENDTIGSQNHQTESNSKFNGQRTEQFDVQYEQFYGQQQSVRWHQQQNQQQGHHQQTQQDLEREYLSMPQGVSSVPLSSEMSEPASSDQLQVPSINYSSNSIDTIPVQIRQDLEALSQDSKYCSNCRITNTPSWRRCPKGQTLLCNACGLYQRLHGRSRPFIQTKDGAIKIRRNIHQHPPCAKCGTDTTTAWHKGVNNETICHDCSIALKQRHGSSSRPTSTSNRSSARLCPSAAAASISNGRRISRSSGPSSRARARTQASMSSLYNDGAAYVHTDYQDLPYNFGSISTTSALTTDWQQTGASSYIGSSLNTRYSLPFTPGAAADVTQNNMEQQITPTSSYNAWATPSTLPSSSSSSRPSSGSMHQDHLSLLTPYSSSSEWAATRPELTSAPQTQIDAQRPQRPQNRYTSQYHLSRQQQLGQNQFHSQSYSPYEIHRYRQYQQQLSYYQQQARHSQQRGQYQGQYQLQPSQSQSQLQPQFQYASSYQHSRQQQQQQQQQHCYHQPDTQYQYQNQYWYQNQQDQVQNQTQKNQVQSQAYDDVFQTYVQGVGSGSQSHSQSDCQSQPQWPPQSQDCAILADISTTARTETDTQDLEEGLLTYNHAEANTNDAMIMADLVIESLSSPEEDASQSPRLTFLDGETGSQTNTHGQEENSSAQQSGPAPVSLNRSMMHVGSAEKQHEELEEPREDEKHGEEQSTDVESNLTHEEMSSSPMIQNEQSNNDAGTSVDTNVERGLRRSIRQRATLYTSNDPASKRQRYDEM